MVEMSVEKRHAEVDEFHGVVDGGDVWQERCLEERGEEGIFAVLRASVCVSGTSVADVRTKSEKCELSVLLPVWVVCRVCECRQCVEYVEDQVDGC